MLFASKAFPCTAVYRLLAEEGLACDVASGGELFLALRGGFDPAADLLPRQRQVGRPSSARRSRPGVGHIVLDSLRRARAARAGRGRAGAPPGGADPDHARGGRRHPSRDLDRADRLEVRLLAGGRPGGDRAAGRRAAPGARRAALPHRLAAARRSSRSARRCGRSPRSATSRSTTWAAASASRTCRPTEPPAVADYVDAIVSTVHAELGADKRLLLEPGRALVANSTVTLYTVQTVKRNVSTWVAVDGGMSDNLRPMLYGSQLRGADRRPAARRGRRALPARRQALRVRRRDRARGVAGRPGARRRDRHAGDRRLRLLAGQQLQRRARARRWSSAATARLGWSCAARPTRTWRRVTSTDGVFRVGLLGHGTVGSAFATLLPAARDADRADDRTAPRAVRGDDAPLRVVRGDPRGLGPDRRADRRDRPGARLYAPARDAGQGATWSPPTSSCSPSTARSCGRRRGSTGCSCASRARWPAWCRSSGCCRSRWPGPRSTACTGSSTGRPTSS